MAKTRLFHALVVCGAAITGGGSIGVITVASVASIAGCGDQSYTIIDMALPGDLAQQQPDMGQYAIIDY